MRAASYSSTGGPEVLKVVDRERPEPGQGEVRVRVRFSGVNPTDCKARGGVGIHREIPTSGVVPHQDGSGTIDAVGSDVTGLHVGDRVWVWEAAWQRVNGTAQEFVVVPQTHAVRLPASASFELGASLGIPALTAHRCLTVSELGASRLAPGALAGMTVLVSGGAGAVGHAALELARWAGAHTIATVSTGGKAELAQRSGADAVVNYREPGAFKAIRNAAKHGIDIFVEVAPVTNARLHLETAGLHATVAAYASEPGANNANPIRELMELNLRYQYVLIYTIPLQAKSAAVEDVASAVDAGALTVGEEFGLPLHHFSLEDIAEAHAAIEGGLVGKALIDMG